MQIEQIVEKHCLGCGVKLEKDDKARVCAKCEQIYQDSLGDGL